MSTTHFIVAEDMTSATIKAEEHAIEQRSDPEKSSVIGQDGSLKTSEEMEFDPWELQTVELISRNVLIV